MNYFIFINISFFILIFQSCTSSMYFPYKEKVYDPRQAGLIQEEVWFIDQDKNNLHGWWFESKSKPSKGTFIFFHGNSGNVTSHFQALSWLPDQGYNYFIFDYPSFGLSDGDKPSPKSCVQSGEAAISWVHANKDKNPLVIYGHSMGGITALRVVENLRNQFQFKLVIIDGSFLSYQEIARDKLSQFWLSWPFQHLAYLLIDEQQAPQKISEISPIPLVVMHGLNDKTVPVKFGEQIYKAAQEPKKLFLIEGGGHGGLFWINNKKYQAEIIKILEPI